jgi:hypothetical protein
MPSPMARTLEALLRSGWIACPVERFIAQRGGIRVDAFHFADILAAHARERRILLVQCTTVPHISTRVRKIRGKPEAAAWLRAGGAIEVWGWHMTAGHWKARILEVRPSDMAAEPLTPVPRRRGRKSRQPELPSAASELLGRGHEARVLGSTDEGGNPSPVAKCA